jgi:aspartyl-tRNA(Asn)/glutamyl-tRNA(Gln) amidotransferase subunit B
MLNDLFRLLNARGQTIGDISMRPAALVALLELVERGVVNLTSARDVLAEMLDGGDPAAIVAARGLGQLSDEAALAALIDRIIDENAGPVASYRAGKTTLLGWFVGQVMRATDGRANPALVNELLRQRLESRPVE